MSVKAEDVNFFGKWQGVSKNIYTLYGDLEFNEKQLVFSIQGNYKYVVLESNEAYMLLELKKPVLCGNYIKLGHYKENQMEFSILKSNTSSPCSWGIYEKRM